MRPVSKRDSDVQWRILHRALISYRRHKHIGYCDTDNCPFCNDPEDIRHIFVECDRLRAPSLDDNSKVF